MSLSDLLDRTARLTGKVFVRGVAIGVVTMLPAGLVFGFAMREIFAALADTMNRVTLSPEPSVDAVLPLLYGMAEFGVALLLFWLASCILQASVIDMTDAEIHAAPRTWQGAFSRGYHAAWRVLAQYLVVLFVIVSMITFSAVIGAMVLHSPGATVLFMIASAGVAGWLAVTWMFGGQAIVCEYYPPVHGLARSRQLVKGNWWRVLGIVLLIGILVQFAVMIVTVPLQGIVFASFINDLMDLEKHMLVQANDPATMEAMMLKLSALGWKLGLLQGATGTLAGIAQGVFTTLLYYDLRARHGEYDEVAVQEHA